MAKKTVIKKACKFHFEDIYNNINTLDNENYDLDLPTDIEVKVKADIEKLDTRDELVKYYNENKSKYTENANSFNKLLAKRQEEIDGTA